MDHFCFSKKKSETPIFIAFPATKLKTGVRFHRLDAVFFKESNFEKKGRPGGQQLFSPKHPDYEKTWKIYWPLPVGHTHTTFRDGSPEKAAKKTHTHTNGQPRHEVEKQHQDRTIKERESQDDDEHWKETNQNPTQKTPDKQKKHQKKRKTPRKKTRHPNNAGTRDKLDRKKVVFQTPKRKTTRNKKQRRIRHSIKT